MQEVPGFAPDLPDALVGVSPAGGCTIRERDEEAALLLRDLAEVATYAMDCVEEFAVHVDLCLRPGAVADADRAAVSPAFQPGQLSLREVAFAADPEHDLDVALAVDGAGCRGQVTQEIRGLIGAGGDPESVECEAGVAHPRVAIVPVALAADGLGKRRGRSSHEGAGLLERQPMEHAAAE